MKKQWKLVSWLAGCVRPYLLSNTLIILMGTIASIGRVAIAIVSKYLIDKAVLKQWDGVIRDSIIIICMILLHLIFRGLASVISVHTTENMSNRIRYQLFLHLSKVKWEEYSKYHSGDLITRMTNDIATVVTGVMKVIPDIISLGVSLVASFIALVIFDPVLAMVSFAVGPVLLVLGTIFGRRFIHVYQKAQEAESSYRSFIQEGLVNMEVLKTFCYEKQSGEELIKLQEEKKHWMLRRNKAAMVSGLLVVGGMGFSFLLAFGIGILRLLKGYLGFGTLTAFLQLIGLIQSPFLGLSGTIPQVISITASAERLMELEMLEKEEAVRTMTDFNMKEICLQEVDFEYQKGKPILKNINTEIRKGERVGIIGKSGEGKTTLIRLLMQLFQPEHGNISYLDYNNGYHPLEPSIRTKISYVPQGKSLFSGTISYNMSIGNPDSTPEEQVKALQAAGAWEFVSQLPEGIDTVIGEGGYGLSEGQAQRIAIARALLRNSPILILDEATSALDIENEEKVLDSILSFWPELTCIIITHRPSILKYCSRIWRLEEGRLYEEKV